MPPPVFDMQAIAGLSQSQRKRLERMVLKQELKSLRGSLRAVKRNSNRNKRESERSLASARGFGAQAKTFFVLVVLLSHSFGTGMEWLELETRRGRWGNEAKRSQTAEELEEEMHTVFLTYHGVRAVEEGQRNIDDLNHFQVQMFLAEWKTFLWLVNYNWKGVAPSSRDAFETVLFNFTPESRGERFDAFARWGYSSTKHLKEWVRGFRRRWHLQWGSMPPKPPLRRDEIVEKVVIACFYPGCFK